MATRVHRITVNLGPDVYGTLKDLSDLSGKSMSFLVSDLMSGIIPQLARTVEVMKAAKEAPEEVRQKLIQQYEESEQKILEAAAIVEDQFDLFEAMAAEIEKK
jgi:hypothetical protein